MGFLFFIFYTSNKNIKILVFTVFTDQRNNIRNRIYGGLEITLPRVYVTINTQSITLSICLTGPFFFSLNQPHGINTDETKNV